MTRWALLPPPFNNYFITSSGELYRYNSRGESDLVSSHYDRYGYPTVSIRYGNKERRTLKLHRLVCLGFFGPSDLQVNHIDGDKRNNSLSNLEYVTGAENIRHAYRTGLKCARGSNNGAAKLSEELVIEIDQDLKSGMRVRDVVVKYGLPQDQISHIKSGKIWSHVTQRGTGYQLL